MHACLYFVEFPVQLAVFVSEAGEDDDQVAGWPRLSEVDQNDHGDDGHEVGLCICCSFERCGQLYNTARMERERGRSSYLQHRHLQLLHLHHLLSGQVLCVAQRRRPAQFDIRLFLMV